MNVLWQILCALIVVFVIAPRDTAWVLLELWRLIFTGRNDQ